MSDEKDGGLSRRDFMRTTAMLGGAVMLSAAASPLLAQSAGSAGSAAGPATRPTARTAADQVPLGKTGLQLSRIGIGTGSSNGYEQTAMGKDGFTRLIHYAYDHGITYIDTAEAYATFHWIADATRGIPREKLFIQSKVDGRPHDVLGVIDHHRQVFQTDYVDSLLVHCMTQPGWTEQWKRVMEAFDTAQQKGWIRAKGVSCHSLPALQDATSTDWAQVHLVRVNPQGKFMDTANGGWQSHPPSVPIQPVLDQIKIMHDKGRGVIGMKICGNGTFKDPADREKSIRFAMSQPCIDAIVIGMTSTEQIDQNLAMVNRALAA